MISTTRAHEYLLLVVWCCGIKQDITLSCAAVHRGVVCAVSGAWVINRDCTLIIIQSYKLQRTRSRIMK